MTRIDITELLERRIETLMAPRLEQTLAITTAIRDLTRYRRYGELPAK